LGFKKAEICAIPNDEKHRDDCARFPFADIPQRIFLDTNVINVLVKYGTNVFEREPVPQDTEKKLAIDIEALMHVFYVGTQAGWGLFAQKQ
jgi:hypothetical protein